MREHFKERLFEYERERETRPLPNNMHGNLLEIGAGVRLTFSSQDSEIYVLDITAEMMKEISKHHQVHAICADAKQVPFKEDSFDIIVSNALLHHLVGRTPTECKTNIERVIKETKRMLTPKGSLFIKELLARNYVFSLIMFYVTFLCAKFGIEIDALDIHSKVITFFLTEKDLNKILTKNGFKIELKRTEPWHIRTKILKIGTLQEFWATIVDYCPD